MNFSGGTIYWTNTTGAHVLYGAIDAEYIATANETDAFGNSVQGILGVPNADMTAIPGVTGGLVVPFQNGKIYWSSATGAHALYGSIGAEYVTTVRATDAYGTIVQRIIGLPTSDEADVPNVPGGRVVAFAGGSIYWSAGTGAHVLYGAIGAEYAATAQETDANGHVVQLVVGLPISDEAAFTGVAGFKAVSGIRVTNFQYGSVYWAPATGAHIVYGAIRGDYFANAAALGAPVTDETDIPGLPGGRMNSFQSGSIYWSAATGAFAVYGAIGTEYTSLGGPTSSLGLPTTDEYEITAGRANYFQNGKIIWHPTTGAYPIMNASVLDFKANIDFSDGTPVGGQAEIEVFPDGTWHFYGSLTDNGIPSYDDTVVATIISPTGGLYPFMHQGHMNGSLEPGSNTDRWGYGDPAAYSPALAAGWLDLQGATAYFKTDVSSNPFQTLLHDIEGLWHTDVVRWLGEAVSLAAYPVWLVDVTASAAEAADPQFIDAEGEGFAVPLHLDAGVDFGFRVSALNCWSMTLQDPQNLPPGLYYEHVPGKGDTNGDDNFGFGKWAGVIPVDTDIYLLGAPTTPGTYTLMFTARNAFGATTTHTFTFIVDAAQPGH